VALVVFCLCDFARAIARHSAAVNICAPRFVGEGILRSGPKVNLFETALRAIILVLTFSSRVTSRSPLGARELCGGYFNILDYSAMLDREEPPGPDVRIGSKNGSARARAARPFYPQVQTSSACPSMSLWCQWTKPLAR
jgi:hypothetical protein